MKNITSVVILFTMIPLILSIGIAPAISFDEIIPKVSDGEWHLYDLSTDPTESYDLQEEYPELFEEMMGYYDEYVERVGVVAPVGQGLM